MKNFLRPTFFSFSLFFRKEEKRRGFTSFLCRRTFKKPKKLYTKRPPTNDRTCMGWHTRHASTSSGLEGHLRPETLNLTAWNHALGLKNEKQQNETKTTTKRNKKWRYVMYIFYYNIYYIY
jgi:hypothetical protein